jgi:hypothetical protein
LTQYGFTLALLKTSRLLLLQRWRSWTGNGTYFLKTSTKHATLLLNHSKTTPRLGYSFKKIRSHSFTHSTGFEGTPFTGAIARLGSD